MEEMRTSNKYETWDVVDLPREKQLVVCKQVFNVKFKANGTIEWDARLVTKGYTQTYSINYIEMFAPVVKFNKIQVLLSSAANLDWLLQ